MIVISVFPSFLLLYLIENIYSSFHKNFIEKMDGRMYSTLNVSKDDGVFDNFANR